MQIIVKSKIRIQYHPKVMEQYYKATDELAKLQKVIRDEGGDCQIIRIEMSY